MHLLLPWTHKSPTDEGIRASREKASAIGGASRGKAEGVGAGRGKALSHRRSEQGQDGGRSAIGRASRSKAEGAYRLGWSKQGQATGGAGRSRAPTGSTESMELSHSHQSAQWSGWS
ncbi:hypothetical protein GUJ93_ZPchr0007g3033 [Zizania palustris]|uniref:Uncharacterized protein n=1 Tax=Zizania palustris TaxID=103762 RepID=A0A8J5TGQ7_ZIZPA|nr:hypothetical protein GUJ93_ZPchr0007g3033 [Zizania palustris]